LLAAENINKAVPSYFKIHGFITYTPEERAEWEAKMTERAARLEIRFRPENYPTTNMVGGTEKAA
jgi:hypothetical protein